MAIPAPLSESCKPVVASITYEAGVGTTVTFSGGQPRFLVVHEPSEGVWSVVLGEADQHVVLVPTVDLTSQPFYVGSSAFLAND